MSFCRYTSPLNVQQAWIFPLLSNRRDLKKISEFCQSLIEVYIWICAWLFLKIFKSLIYLKFFELFAKLTIIGEIILSFVFFFISKHRWFHYYQLVYPSFFLMWSDTVSRARLGFDVAWSCLLFYLIFSPQITKSFWIDLDSKELILSSSSSILCLCGDKASLTTSAATWQFADFKQQWQVKKAMLQLSI